MLSILFNELTDKTVWDIDAFLGIHLSMSGLKTH